MPELPEVEAARRAIEEHCVGKRIKTAVVADDPKVIDAVSPSQLQFSLVGKTILAALRKGKNLWLRLDSPPFPSFQFGMAGAVYIKGVAVTKYKRSAVGDEEEWPSKYSKVFMELDDGLELSFTDKRRFARVRLLQDPESVPPISELGPDALLEPIPADEFAASLRRKNIAIKALLLDQSFISGIGNWIADEVLYQAKIHPLEYAANLTKESCESLHKCIKEVIRYAVEVDAECSRFPLEWLFHFRWGKKTGTVNGKSFPFLDLWNQFILQVIGKAVEVGADSSQFPNNWIFHTREKKPGKAFVDGKKIEFITAGGRTSAYVPELQKLSAKSGKAPSRPKKSKPFVDAANEGSHNEPKDGEDLEKKSNAKRKNGQTSKAIKKPIVNEETQPKSGKSGRDRSKKTIRENVEKQASQTAESENEEENDELPKKRKQGAKKTAPRKKAQR